jgi:hypothetical protein
MVRANIEELVRQQMQPFEASLIGSVVGIIQDCQDRVFRAYREGICDDEDVHMSPSIDMETDASLPPSEVVYTGMQSNQNQYQSSHFLDAVFQHPPPLKSAGQCPSPLCAVDQLHTSTQSTTDTVLSDSGYASEQLCNCLGPCICLARTISSQSQEATAVESQRIDARDEDFQWHDWIDNLGWNHMDEMDGEDRNEANAID